MSVTFQATDHRSKSPPPRISLGYSAAGDIVEVDADEDGNVRVYVPKPKPKAKAKTKETAAAE